MLIETRPSLDPELAALVTAQQREIHEIDGGRGQRFMPDDDSVYLVAVVGGRAVACAAWRALPGDGVAELKRMYVRPAFRGRGIARQLIVAVEEEALAAGRPVIRLETGSHLPASIALYRSSGYLPIPAYGEYAGNPSSVCFEKRLAALVQ
jgi:GNAT superfamily N-acetyltransferase